MKVELDPDAGYVNANGVAASNPNNVRPVILRIVHIEHDRPDDPSAESPYRLDETLTQVEIHLSYQTIENP